MAKASKINTFRGRGHGIRSESNPEQNVLYNEQKKQLTRGKMYNTEYKCSCTCNIRKKNVY
jgi:hypothetical protein